MTARRRFLSVAAAGISFQAGSAAVDSATIMSALAHQLTGSAIVVGAVPAILRFGWLFPQFFVGFLTARSGSAMRYYRIGAFGRAAAIAAMALVLWVWSDWPPARLGMAVMALWTVYAFVSGVVAAPYNDIVARAVPSERRSRLLALRFFGGGVLALGVAAAADGFIRTLSFPLSYAAILGMAAALMVLSSFIFVAMGEPPVPAGAKAPTSFATYFRDGVGVFRADPAFRRFVFAQWCGGGVLMAAPFYVVAASEAGAAASSVALLLAAQTAGGLASNPLWGWWGDFRGKQSLMRGVAALRMVPPAALLASLAFGLTGAAALPVFAVAFFMLGALANGLTIAVIGLLMEISPEDRRPQYSGYFNAVTAPAYLAPLLAGVLVAMAGTAIAFALSLAAAFAQFRFVSSLTSGSPDQSLRRRRQS